MKLLTTTGNHTLPEEEMCIDDFIDEVDDFETMDDYVDVNTWNTMYDETVTRNQASRIETPAGSTQSASGAPQIPVSTFALTSGHSSVDASEARQGSSQITSSTHQGTPSASQTCQGSSQVAPSTSQNTSSASRAGPNVNNDNVNRFRKSLSTLPQSQSGFKPWKGSRPSNAAEVISKAIALRAETIREKIKQDAYWKNEEMAINRERLELEREMRIRELELKKAEIESKERIRMAEIESMRRRGGNGD